MRARLGLARLVACLAAAVLLATSCGGGRPAVEPLDPSVLRVASFDFPESRLLAELYGLRLRQAGFPVEVLTGLGTREVVAPALEQGLVDIVVDYTGSLLDRYGGTAEETHGTPEAVHRVADRRLAARGLTVLRYAPAEDTNGFAVRTSFAREHLLSRISDLRPIAPGLTLGGPPECPQRRTCLLGLQDVYGLTFRAFRAQPTRGTTATALETGEIDVGMLETTYGRLGDRRVTLLVDDLGLQPRENVVPVVRTEVVRRYGLRLTSALDELSGRLDNSDLIRLNRLGAVDPRGPAAVAAAYLPRVRG